MSSPAQPRIALVSVVLALAVVLGWVVYFRRSVAVRETAAPMSPVAVAVAPATAAPPISPSAANSVPPAPVAGFRAAAEAARLLRNPTQRALEFGRTLEAWIARDPEAALAYVRGLKPGADYSQGLLMALAAIGRTDPDRALALAAELAKTREERAIYSALFAQLAAADPVGAAARLSLVPAGEGRGNALRALADGWAHADLPAALAWAQKLNPTDRAPAMETVITTLVATDPLRAVDLAQQNLSGAAFERTLLSALQALARTDPKSAAALVSTLAPGEARTQASYFVARALATESPSGAMAWAQTLPVGEVRARVLNNILDIWAAKDPVAAGQEVVKMAGGAEQEMTAAHLATLLAANPPSAIAWAQSLANEAARSAAVVNLASAWAQRDPSAAARWAGSLEPVDVRNTALNGAISYWVLQDSDAARNYIFGLSGETQVSAAAHLAPALAQRDPVAAITWSQTLPSAEARESALTAAYARWLTNEPAAARSWLSTANLPAATKARLTGP
jgi:hypothetical protein